MNGEGKAHPPGHGDGREIEYDDALMAEICRRHGEGEELLEILASDGMPSWATFFRRTTARDAPPELQDAYAQAREAFAARKVAEITMIAEEDPAIVFDQQGRGENAIQVARVDSAAVKHQELRVRVRQWVAERMLARIYAPHHKQTHQNPDGTPLGLVPAVEVIVLNQPKEE